MVASLTVSDRSFWAGRRVLVTGHTGFKGAWLCLCLQRLDAEVTGLALPAEDADGAFAALSPWAALDSRIADIRDADAVKGVMRSASPEVVFHLAAQSLVRRGWSQPERTYAVNVLGTSNVLEAVATVGCARAVVVVTSDKVYNNSGSGAPFREDSALGGSDPYSASKAAAELVVDAWRLGHPEVPVTTVRAGNVIGGGDVAEDRLLPDAWRALRANKDLVLRHPKANRPWQFVLDPLAGYLQVAEALVDVPRTCPRSLNFGPSLSGCWSVLEVVESVLAAWGRGRWLDGSDPGGPLEMATLTLDTELARRTLGWRPRLDLETAIRWTVEWWRAAGAGNDLGELAAAQIQAYEHLPEL